MNQSALGWYGQGDAGHSHNRLRAEGEDGVLPAMSILLVMTETESHDSPTHDWSHK